MGFAQRGIALARWAWDGIRSHPLLSACVLYLVVKQVAVIWVFRGAPELPLNMLFALAGTALLALPWAFLARGAARLLALAAIDLAFGFVLLTDLVYYRQFADLPSVASLQYAGLAADVHEVVQSLLRPADVLLFAGPLLLVGLLVVKREWVAGQRRISPRRALLLMLIGGGLIASVAGTTSRLKKPFGGHTVVASRLGPMGYHIYDAGTVLGRGIKRRFGSTEEQLAEAKAFFASRPQQPASPFTGTLHGKNVIVVQLESWQAFTTHLEVGGKPVTPHFNELARESILFTRMHSQVGQGTTSDAELGTHCSLYPMRTGSVYYEHATNDLRCLPEVLRENGYATAALHANRPDFWNRAAMYPTVGIDTFFDQRAFGEGERIGLGLNDEQFFDEAVDKLKTLPEPYYAMMISITSHGPFDFANLPRELEHGKFEGTRTAAYLDAVHYTDQALGKLVDKLKREGILDKSILIVYGDHMGVARDSSNVGEYLSMRDDDPLGWFVTERRIPALIRLPGGVGASVRTTTAGQVDFAPTVVSLLGLRDTRTVFFGRDLLADEPGFVAFPNGSAASDDLVYLTADGGHGSGGCWSLADQKQVPGTACGKLADRAQRELGIAWEMVDSDLVARVAGVAPTHAVSSLDGI